MTLPSFAEFEARQRAQGCDAVLVREWAPNQVVDTHTHPFDASAIVVQGEMWLTVGSNAQHLRAVDTFELPRNTPHAERYGADGAVYWVGRRGS